MRCLFTMFAQNIGLPPKGSFLDALRGLKDHLQYFAPVVHSLWASIDKGGFCPGAQPGILRFNGGLFENSDAIPLDAEQLELLIDAAEWDWSAAEPSIFGTLLERALDNESASGSVRITRRAPISGA
jgi:hypothetical protein